MKVPASTTDLDKAGFTDYLDKISATTDLDKAGFTDYLDKISAETGVPLPDPEAAGYI